MYLMRLINILYIQAEVIYARGPLPMLRAIKLHGALEHHIDYLSLEEKWLV